MNHLLGNFNFISYDVGLNMVLSLTSTIRLKSHVFKGRWSFVFNRFLAIILITLSFIFGLTSQARADPPKIQRSCKHTPRDTCDHLEKITGWIEEIPLHLTIISPVAMDILILERHGIHKTENLFEVAVN
jgi:hypothetical protein